MKAILAIVLTAALALPAFAQTTGGRTSGAPPVDDRGPGTAASDVSPGAPAQGPTRSGANGGLDAGSPQGGRASGRQTQGTHGAAPTRDAAESRRANRDRGASAVQSYGYPASSAQGR